MCDDGNFGNNHACTNACVLVTCGDGAIHESIEACDDGNLDNTRSCLITCELFDWCEAFAIESMTPPLNCSNLLSAQVNLTATGRVLCRLMAVTWDGIAADVTLSSCAAITGVKVNAQVCAALTFDIPALAPPPPNVGDYAVVVTNPVTQIFSKEVTFSGAASAKPSNLTDSIE
ncbi:MAG: hypothetical protein JXR76_28920 [Deltaproteobacteria bacterium]|nr:hypothetical protein [Deltaproteobacteria bacterium]